MNRRILMLGAVGALAVGACNENRAILTDPITANAYDFQMVNLATNLPRGTARFRFGNQATDSVVLTLQGNDSLSTGFYTAWIGDSLGTNWKRATGLLTAVRQDTGQDAIGNAIPLTPVSFNFGQQSAIQNGGPRTVFTWTFTRASAGLLASDSIQTFMISLEGTNAATAPNASRRPLWARRGDGSGASPRSISLRFGNWNTTPLTEYLFSSTPARGRAFIQASLMEVDDSTLARAPMGYYYATYAIKAATKTAPGDTVFLGDMTSPYPRRNLSLYNSDSLVTDPLVVLTIPPSILSSSIRMSADSIPKLTANGATTPYKGYTEVRTTLENKNSARGRMGPARVLVGSILFFITVGQNP
jgi:hypothetical protein